MHEESTLALLLRRVMLGESNIPASVVLLATAIVGKTGCDSGKWIAYKVGQLELGNDTAIARARKAILNGESETSLVSCSNFDDWWIAYVVVDSGAPLSRQFLIELRDPCDFSDPGAILDVQGSSIDLRVLNGKPQIDLDLDELLSGETHLDGS